MADWKEMYLTLFRETTVAITQLQAAQAKTEALYLSAPEHPLHILEKNKPRQDL